YLPVIRFATKRRWTTVAIGLVILIGTFALSTRLETNFLDESGQDSIAISQQLPVGTSLAATDEAARKVEAVIAGRDDVKSYQVTVGNGEFNPFVGSGGASGASFNVALDQNADASRVSDELRGALGALPGVGEVTVGGDSGTGFNANELAVIVQASDNDVLARAPEEGRAAVAGTAAVIGARP